jgi:hypothetical protein
MVAFREKPDKDESKNKGKPREKALLMGLGLDSKDGHKRITKGENYLLVGGSEETHERMGETAIKFNEKLSSKGKRLEEISSREFIDIMGDVTDKIK